MSDDLRRRQAGINAILAEDHILAEIMEGVRWLSTKSDESQIALIDQLDKAGQWYQDESLKAFERAYQQASAEEREAGEFEGGFMQSFLLQAASFGCVSIAQKALEEWEKYNRGEESE